MRESTGGHAGPPLQRTSIGLLLFAAASLWAAERPLLVDPSTLKSELGRVRIVDLRDNEKDYLKGHIPGALHLPVRRLDNLEANRQGLPVPLDQARTVFAALGLNRDTQVVGYDDSGNRSAARLLYFLQFFGHQNVRVLDGGFRRWVSEGGKLETGEVKVPPGSAAPRPKSRYLATGDWLNKRLNKKKVTVLDARSEDEYAGRQKTPGRPGHIPGAIDLDWRQTLTPDGRFKSVEELRALLAGKGVSPRTETVTYCNSGVRAAELYLALRLAGYDKVRLYDGSWEDWGTDTRRPVEK